MLLLPFTMLRQLPQGWMQKQAGSRWSLALCPCMVITQDTTMGAG
jgi:hypothetical protein